MNNTPQFDYKRILEYTQIYIIPEIKKTIKDAYVIPHITQCGGVLIDLFYQQKRCQITPSFKDNQIFYTLRIINGNEKKVTEKIPLQQMINEIIQSSQVIPLNNTIQPIQPTQTNPPETIPVQRVVSPKMPHLDQPQQEQKESIVNLNNLDNNTQNKGNNQKKKVKEKKEKPSPIKPSPVTPITPITSNTVPSVIKPSPKQSKMMKKESSESESEEEIEIENKSEQKSEEKPKQQHEIPIPHVNGHQPIQQKSIQPIVPMPTTSITSSGKSSGIKPIQPSGPIPLNNPNVKVSSNPIIRPSPAVTIPQPIAPQLINPSSSGNKINPIKPNIQPIKPSTVPSNNQNISPRKKWLNMNEPEKDDDLVDVDNENEHENEDNNENEIQEKAMDRFEKVTSQLQASEKLKKDFKIYLKDYDKAEMMKTEMFEFLEDNHIATPHNRKLIEDFVPTKSLRKSSKK